MGKVSEVDSVMSQSVKFLKQSNTIREILVKLVLYKNGQAAFKS